MFFTPQKMGYWMVRLLDNLHAFKAVAVALLLVLAVDGFLFDRDQSMQAPTTTAAPSVDDTVLAGDNKDYDSVREGEPGEKGTEEQAEQPEDNNRGELGAQETD